MRRALFFKQEEVGSGGGFGAGGVGGYPEFREQDAELSAIELPIDSEILRWDGGGVAIVCGLFRGQGFEEVFEGDFLGRLLRKCDDQGVFGEMEADRVLLGRSSSGTWNF